jgi:hypothetical protein
MLLSCFTASGNKRARISVIRFCIFISILIFAFQATGYLAVAYASTFSGSYLAAQHAASTKSFESAARYYNEVVENRMLMNIQNRITEIRARLLPDAVKHDNSICIKISL